MKLYIVRHGRTDWNVQSLVQGATDIELNAEGLAQAEEARKKFEGTPIDLCISSPLKRAKKTAEIITAGRCPIIEDADILEIRCGKYEGHKMSEVPWKAYWNGELAEEENGIEPIDCLYGRLRGFVEKLLNEYKGKLNSVLVVSHGGAINIIRKMLHEMNAKSDCGNRIVENCEICTYEI